MGDFEKNLYFLIKCAQNHNITDFARVTVKKAIQCKKDFQRS